MPICCLKVTSGRKGTQSYENSNFFFDQDSISRCCFRLITPSKSIFYRSSHFWQSGDEIYSKNPWKTTKLTQFSLCFVEIVINAVNFREDAQHFIVSLFWQWREISKVMTILPHWWHSLKNRVKTELIRWSFKDSSNISHLQTVRSETNDRICFYLLIPI